MAILNYTTKIAPEKTAIEIQKKLVSAGARGILTQYDNDGVMVAITFQLEGPQGPLYYNLPANIDKVYIVLQNSNISRGFKNREQAGRVAWRIIKDWIEAQIALVETEMVEMTEVFLPYMQTDNGETVYQRLQSNNYQLALPSK